jgi:Dehydrogenases (flavoproteins)
LVVGGGLAGLHFAKLMADHSPVGADNITVVEKYPKGKVKLCAEGLINYARNLGVVPDEFLEIPFCDVTLRVGGAATRLSDNVPLITTYNKRGFLKYEADLIKDAGGTVIDDHRVSDLDLKLENGSALITSPGKDSKSGKNEERIKYDILIGADGAHSVVRRWLEEWNFIDEDEMDRSAIAIQGNAGPYPELEWGMDLEKFRGLWWVFPHEKYTAVGIGILKSEHDKFDLNAFLKYFNDRGIHISKESVKGHPIVCSPRPRMATGLKDVYLLGEAGGFTKGSSGEGFSGAMISASRLVQRLLSSSRDKKVKLSMLISSRILFGM